jgi:hypothetical protein
MRGYRGPWNVPSWGMMIRQTGLTGGKILPTHGHRDGGKDRSRLLPGPIPFRLVVPPLHAGVVGPYLVWGT